MVARCIVSQFLLLIKLLTNNKRIRESRIISSPLFLMQTSINIIIFLLVSVFGSLRAQNLVLNGDFESYFLCPSSPNVYKANHWYNPTLCGTPDYFQVDLTGQSLGLSNTA
jgi:hypothetical protein